MIADRNSLTVELGQLAREPSSQKRRALLRQITDLFFLDERQRNVSEMVLFEEIVTRVIQQVDLGGRIEFAERIADEPNAPRSLVLSLATGEIEVARPVLARSPVLIDSDLVEIAASGGDLALQAIAERRSLSELLTDVLIRRGSQLVAQLLAGNTGASFSKFGFREVVRRSAGDETLQLHLATRSDLPADVVADLVPLLSVKLMRGLVEKGVTSPETMSAAMLDRLSAGMDNVLKERVRETQDVSAIIADLKSGKTTIDREVMELTKADRAYDLATLVAGMTGIEHPMAMKALTGTNNETLIVLFRMMRCEWFSFETVLHMRAKRQRRTYIHSNTIQRAFQDMDESTAQRVMRFLIARRQTENIASA